MTRKGSSSQTRGVLAPAACLATAALFTFAAAAAVPARAEALDWNLPAQTLSGQFGNTPYQQIGVGSDGTTTIVWREYDGANDRVRASTRAPAGAWPNPATPGAVETISPIGLDASSPQVAVGPDGAATAVWILYDGSNYIVQAATRPAGQASFGTPQDLTATGLNASSPQIATAPDGTTTVVWGRSNGSNTIVQAATRPAGQASFGTPEDLSQAGQSAFLQSVANGPDGSTVAAWTRSDGSGSAVIQATLRGAGQSSFGTPETLSQSGQIAGDPKAVITSEGTTIVTWRRNNGSNLIIQAAMRAAGQSSFSTPQDLSQAGQSAVVPQIGAAPDGTTTVAWNRSNGSRLIVQAATRQPGQSSFGTPEDLSSTSASSFNQHVAVAPDGTTTVSWARNNGSDAVIQASTRPPGGPWPDPNVAGSLVDLSEAGENGQLPQMGIAADGSITVTWQFYSPATGGNNIVQAATSSSTSYPLSVTKEGAGSGTVTSSPTGIDCGSTCSASFALSTRVTLTAIPASGSSFSGWGGSCSGEATTCTVTVLGARSATATFTGEPAPPPPTPPSNRFTLGRSRVEGNSILTRAAVPGAGRLSQLGTFRPRGGSGSSAATRTACRAKPRNAASASTVTLDCRLTTAARAERRKRAVAVRLCTTFAPTGGSARTSCRTVVLSSRRPHYTG